MAGYENVRDVHELHAAWDACLKLRPERHAELVAKLIVGLEEQVKDLPTFEEMAGLYGPPKEEA